jgi:molybdopterin/thiamine biosynthesis adenylyltransferase
MNKVIVTRKIWDKTSSHLLQNDDEHLAFLLANTAKTNSGITFLIQDFLLISDQKFTPEKLHMELSLDQILNVINTAKKKNMSLIEIHSHPFSTHQTTFSFTDLDGFKEFVPYVLDSLPEKPYGALVLGQKSIDGMYWESKIAKPINKLEIVDEDLTILPTTSNKEISDIDFERFDRQILAFGKEGQKIINQLKIAIVGAGGLGSHIIQQLAYLGVKDFTIIEFDKISKNNMNRLIGSTKNDIGKSKTDISIRLIESISNDCKIRIIEKDLRDKEAINALKEVDFIFGCVDNDAARQILNEIAKAHMIPYIDSAVGINVENDKISDIGGRIVFVKPGSPCLQCIGEIDPREVNYFFQTDQERKYHKNHGYVQNYDLPSPSVVFLNGLIASAAVSEFFAYITGYRVPKSFLSFDGSESKLVERKIKPDVECFVCNSITGTGDKADIGERYAIKN